MPYQPFANTDAAAPSGSDSELLLGVAVVGQESGDLGSISIYHEGDPSTGLTNQAHVNSGSAIIVALPTDGICDNCKFLKWGGFAANVNFDNQNGDGSNNVLADGFWVTGNMTSAAELGDLRNSGAQATYSGKAWASVVNLNQNEWNRYIAWGKMGMNSNSDSARAPLEISNFDSKNFNLGGSGL